MVKGRSRSKNVKYNSYLRTTLVEKNAGFSVKMATALRLFANKVRNPSFQQLASTTSVQKI